MTSGKCQFINWWLCFIRIRHSFNVYTPELLELRPNCGSHQVLMGLFVFSTDGTFHHINLFIVSTCDKDNHLPVVYSASCKLSLWCLTHADWQEVNSSPDSSDPEELGTGGLPRLPPGGTAQQVQMCWCCWRAGWGLCNSASSEGSILMWEPVCSENIQTTVNVSTCCSNMETQRHCCLVKTKVICWPFKIKMMKTES